MVNYGPRIFLKNSFSMELQTLSKIISKRQIATNRFLLRRSGSLFCRRVFRLETIYGIHRICLICVITSRLRTDCSWNNYNVFSNGTFLLSVLLTIQNIFVILLWLMKGFLVLFQKMIENNISSFSCCVTLMGFLFSNEMIIYETWWIRGSFFHVAMLRFNFMENWTTYILWPMISQDWLRIGRLLKSLCATVEFGVCCFVFELALRGLWGGQKNRRNLAVKGSWNGPWSFGELEKFGSDVADCPQFLWEGQREENWINIFAIFYQPFFKNIHNTMILN